MPTVVTVFFLALCLPVTLRAQVIEFGAKAGFDFSSASTQFQGQSPVLTYNTGVTAGIVANTRLYGILGAQIELLWSQKGFSQPEGRFYRSHFVVEYVEIPAILMIEGDFTGDFIAAPRLYGGISWMAKTSEHLRGQNFYGMDLVDIEETLFSRTNTAFVSGIGLKRGTGKPKVLVDLRYSAGLKNMAGREDLLSATELFRFEDPKTYLTSLKSRSWILSTAILL